MFARRRPPRRPLLLPVLLLACIAAPAAAQPMAAGGELRVVPAAPRAGEAVEVAYRPGSLLRDADALVLRARMRTPHDQEALAGAIGAETRRVATLARRADGWYRGRYVPADSVVYTLLAVESADGERVDTHGNGGWEVLAHDARGVPLPAALDQRGWDLAVRDATGGLRNARERLRLYPDDPGGLWRLSFYEGYVLGRDSATALARGRRATFDALARTLDAQPRVDGARAEAMAFMAEVLGDSAARAHWAERQLRDDPLHPLAVQAGARRIVGEGASAEPLAALERLWDEAGPAHDQLLQAGLRASLQAQDVDAARRWTARIEQALPVARPMLGLTFLQMPPLREEGVRLLRVRLDELAAARDEDRDLFRAASRQRDAADDEAASLLLALGQAHLAAGERDEALRALAGAAASGWDPDRLQAVAALLLAAGDTAGAAVALARAAADPAAPAHAADSARVRLGGHGSAEAWAVRVADARRALDERVRRARVDRPLPVLALLADADGRPSALQDRLGAAPATVVVFWASGCPFSRQAMPEVQRLHARGIPVIAITHEEPTPGVRAYLAEQGITLPVLFDPRRASHAAFGSAVTPQFFVVDSAARVRYEFSSLGEVARQAASLAGG